MSQQEMVSNVEWEMWGEHDPLYGVATFGGKAKSDDAPWTDSEFYAVGEELWGAYKSHWDRYGRTSESTLEIGCGAGRLTRALAKDFRRVEAVDVSPGMIEYARRNVDQPHVTFHVTGGVKLPLADQSVSGAFSAHVFQHFTSLKDAAAYFREIHRVLTPGGALMIHAPLHIWPKLTIWPPFRRAFDLVYGAYKLLGAMKGRFIRWRMKKGEWRPYFAGLSYPIEWVEQTLMGIGFEGIEFQIFDVGRHRHEFVVARKKIGVSSGVSSE